MLGGNALKTPLFLSGGWAILGSVLGVILLSGTFLRAAEPANPGYDGSPIDPSHPVAVRFLSPKPEEVLTDNEVDAFFQVDNYQINPGGNCLHVILDNQAPVVIDSFVAPAIFQHLAEGGHTLRVLAARPEGLALENPEAYAMVHFFVRRRDFQNFVDPTLPYLTVNLPLAEPVTPGADGRVWFDFRAHNVTLAKDGYHVRYRVNETEAMQDEDKPVYWENLKPGRYQLTAELLDAALHPVPGLFNSASRSFEVQAAVKAIPVAPVPAVAAPAPTAAAAPSSGMPTPAVAPELHD